MTIKATAALSILAIWIGTLVGVVISHGAWPAIIFALLATGAVGVSAARRLGISRLVAVAGTWAAIGWAIGAHEGNWWISVFAFLTTGAVVYSTLRRDALVAGMGVAAAWLAVAAATQSHPGAAWMGVFAFLTAGAISNTGGGNMRGASAILWWGIAAGIVIAGGDGWAWVSVLAFLLTSASLGFSDFSLPRGLEWDLFDRDDDSGSVR